MTDSEREKLDQERKWINYLTNELNDLKFWLMDGYKHCEGRERVIQLIEKECLSLSTESGDIMLKLFPKK